MNIPAVFNEIRPYTPEELPQVFEELIADPAFQAVVAQVMPQIPFDQVATQLRQCKTNLEVQKRFFHTLLHQLLKTHSKGFLLDTTALPEKNHPYTFVSNHRDIVLDAGFLSVGLIDNGFPTTVEIAIGDNLLIHPWIKKLVRINKSFIVKRGLSMREVLEASKLMSQYIHFAVKEKAENVWIAQREGRAKDSNDHTQESILKMLAMGGEGDYVDQLLELHICPLSLSYEYDPCDYLKAQEMQLKRDIEDYKKTQADDLHNMQVGIFGYKGMINFKAAPVINPFIETLRHLPKTAFYTQVATYIDQEIHKNYILYSGNYVAVDLLEESNRMSSYYTEAEKQVFSDYIATRIEMIDIKNKDIPFLRKALLTMYANPTYNYLKAHQA